MYFRVVRDHSFARICFQAASVAEVEIRASKEGAENDPSTERSRLIRAIDAQLEMVGLLEKRAEERAILAKARSRGLPHAQDIDKFIRYEAHLDRMLYRAMDQLERRQRRRKGEKVPPPLNVRLA